jgi:flagellar assembly protein FliH
MKPQSAGTPRKFTFDEHFDGGHAPRASATPKAKKFYTPEEVEAATAEAFERGRGSLEAITAQAQSLALGQIAQAAITALRTLDEMAAEARAQALQTGLVAARRIAGAALDRYPLDTVEETIAQCLAQAATEPRIVIKVSDRVADALKARIAALADDIGFTGRLVVSVEARQGVADCRLEWTDGGVERDAALIESRIQTALDRFIDADMRRAAETIGA